MPRVSKRKAHLQQISYLQNKGKRRKLHKDTRTKFILLNQQIRDEDFWDEYESSILESSSDESSFDEFNSDQFSTDESGTEEDLCLRSGKQGEISKEVREKLQQMTDLKWQPGAGTYLQSTRGCGSASTDKRQKRHRQKLEAEASKCRSIPEMFSVQRQTVPVKEPTRVEIQIQTSHNLDDLLQHKTKQITSKFIIRTVKNNN